MKKISFMSITLSALVFMAGCSSMPLIRSGGVVVENEDMMVKVAFGEQDRRIIRDYYGKRYKYKKKKGMPPGLAKKGHLPPGLQKRFEKKGKLPPGLAKRFLPAELERRLSRLPEGYVRLTVSGDVILLHEPTHVIVDIIHGVG